MNTKDIVIRDPFILADEGRYYLYGTRSETAWGHGDGFDVYESSDLEEWTGPAEIFRRPANFWADKEFWAPECIRKGDKYYLIATFGTEGKPKGIQILESDTPAGPFALLTECPITPKDWNCLDGTVYTDASGTSWLVFSHSFPQEPGGAITAARLSDDMTRLVSEPQTLFHAQDAAWTRPIPFAKEEFELNKFRKRNRRFYDLNMEQAHLVASYQPLISFLGKVLLLAVVIAGGLLVIHGNMTLGTLGAFSEYANNIIWPMEIIGWLSNDIASAAASWKKIQTIMGEKPVIKNQENALVPEEIQGRLTFDNVSLKLDGQQILENVSFDLQPGKTLGIMGMTGAGKSMLVSLAQRFYDPTEGRILLDSMDVKTLSLASLRSSMAVVFQDVFLFSDTVNQNIRMGQKRRMMPETVRWALKLADALGFVSQLGEQEETLIGERGVGLSGGQKQRISIARAMAKKAPILILDDSTSALDMETERQIQSDLKKVEHISKIIIGHRISAVRDADEILILENGKVLERGTHEDLMRRRGQYYHTWCVQYGEEATAQNRPLSGGEAQLCQ